MSKTFHDFRIDITPADVVWRFPIIKSDFDILEEPLLKQKRRLKRPRMILNCQHILSGRKMPGIKIDGYPVPRRR